LIGESLESLIQNNVGGNPEAGTVSRQGQIKELFVGVKFSTFFSSTKWSPLRWGSRVSPGVPVKIFRMVDCRTQLLEHSGKCVGYVTLYLYLTSRLRHPPFTYSLHYRVSQKIDTLFTD